MQVKDITDLMIYKAIRKAKSEPFSGKFAPEYVDAPEKVTLRKMEKMVDEGKLDYGVSLRTAWVVE